MAEPMRMCIGCRAHMFKKDLIRIVRTPTGEVVADAGNKTAGRGAYICRKAACLQKARKSRALERVLSVHISEQTYEQLQVAVKQING